MKWVYLPLFLFACIKTYGQSVPLSYTIKESPIKELWDKWEEVEKEKEEVKVWRVLILGVENRRKLDAEIKRFSRNYPHLEYDWSYDAPLYKLKVGACIERLCIRPLVLRLKEEYPASLEIRDDITYERYFEINGHGN